MSPTRRLGLGLPHRLRLCKVVGFSLPPFVVAFYRWVASVGVYQQLSQRDDSWSNTSRVDNCAWWPGRAKLEFGSGAAEFDYLVTPLPCGSYQDLALELQPWTRAENAHQGRIRAARQFLVHHGLNVSALYVNLEPAN